MKNTISKLLSILLLGTSCSGTQKDQNPDKINLDSEVSRIDLSSMIKNIEVIHLAEDKNHTIGNILKVDVIDNKIYLIDKPSRSSNPMTIYKFSRKGEPLNKFSNQGAGPNEYLEIIDFDINEQNKEILLLCFPPKLLTLDLDFNLKKEETILDQTYTQVTSTENIVYLYNYYSGSLDAFEKDKKNNLMKFESPKKGVNYSTSSGDFSFFKNEKDIYLQPHLDTTIYKLTNGSSTIFREMSYKDAELSKQFFESTNIEDISLNDRGKYKLPQVKFLIKNDSSTRISYKWGIESRIFCMNKKGETQNISSGSLYGNISPISKDSFLIGSLNIEDYPFDEEYTIEAYKDIEFKNKPSKDSLLNGENQNPIIVLYHFNP